MSGDRVAVLEWKAWEGFLLTHVLGNDAERIEVDPFRELPSEEFDRICDSFATVCFQINLSVRGRLPLRIRDLTNRFVERGVFVVNGFVQDIRKSTLQTHLETIGLPSVKVTPSGSSHEVLFVKTDLNYGGDLERHLPPESIAAAGFERLISPEIKGAYYYKTALRETLPAEIWNDPAIMIEKYIDNAENSFYRVYFSGERVIIVKAFAARIIKKLSNDPRDTNYVSDLEHLKAGRDELELSETLKRNLVTFLEQSAVEFGCLDIVHDGNDNFYIVDLNLTPYAGRRPIDSFLTNFLRAGLGNPPQRKLSDFVNSPLTAVAD
ncbi:MAG TPA: hypothetical protein VFT44_16000 [Pyrinomonadaceae bacterium]|nr:hypothetical protein [Pyrinomonadaceae bacterium]